MATVKKKPTKAHKSKKVVKAHQGMAHVPRQPTRRPTLSGRRAATDVVRPTRSVVDPSKSRPTKVVQDKPMPTTIDTVSKPTRRPLTKAEKDQGMRYANPTGTLVSMPDPKPTRRPTVIDTVGKPMDERARRRRDNALKSELDEAARRANRRPRRPRPLGGIQPAQPIRQPRLAMPYNPAADNFPIGKPNTTVVRGLGPLRNNFNLQQSTALTDRFTKPIDRGPMPNARTQRRNKGGDVKKYAVGGLNKGMTKSRTKYGTVDNKKK